MKKRFYNNPLILIILLLVAFKVLATFGCFFHNRLLPATFPSVLYIYVFFLSLFTTDFSVALNWLPYLFIGASLPAIASCVILRHNRNAAGFASFLIAMLSLGDILFILVHPLTNDLIPALGAIGLNLMIIIAIVLLHLKNKKPAE